MSFEYSEYYKILFVAALCIMVVSIVAITIHTIIYFKKRTTLNPKKFPVVFLANIVILVFFFTLGAVPFARGIYLPNEKEAARVVACGEITRYYKAYGNNKYFNDGKNCFAHYVFINNEKYYIMDIGDLEVGDSVSFEYLPKSKIILNIKKLT